MSVRSIVLIAVALLLTVTTVVFVRGWLESQRNQVVEQKPVEPQVAKVLVAAVALPTGTFIKRDHLRWQAWPDESLSDRYILKAGTDMKDLEGAVVRRGIAAGEPITTGRIVKPGDRGFLAAVLKPGHRAVSVPIDATAGIAGLVFPGDRVDIILSHIVLRPEDEVVSERRASETVLTNVRVLALDQKIDDQSGEPKLAKTATLEVTPKQVEMLAVVRQLGSLSLSLRALAKDSAELERLVNGEAPLDEPEPGRGESYTWETDVSRLVPRHDGDKGVVSVSHGNQVEELRF
jgi:pilus assembly protein CpaB